MSRIEEALRRAGLAPAERAGLEAARRDCFVSPWPTDVMADASQSAEPFPEAIRRDAPRAAPQLRAVPHAAMATLTREVGVRLAVGANADAALSHQFRRLAATLIHAASVQTLKVVMITSAAPEDGKTMTALNLALVLSESFRHRVLLIEADLRRPSIGRIAHISIEAGLAAALSAGDERPAPAVALTERLSWLPAGRPDPDPLSGLTSPRMQRLLADAAGQHDWVIVDTPPVGAAADAGLLCPLVDGVVLVIRARRTQLADVEQAVATLGRDRILGVVLNAVDGTPESAYGTYYADNDAPAPR